MSDFDLDIQNYSIKDLERFFKLKPSYTESDVEYKEYEIREQLLSSGTINRRLQRDIIDFLKKASEWLVYSKFGKKAAPTEIPKNWQLDRENFPVSKDTIQSGVRGDMAGGGVHIGANQMNLIAHPDKQFIYANNSDVYSGVLNPLNTRIISKYVNIDTRISEDCIPKTSDFTIQLPERLKKVVSMQLSAIEMPTSYFNISAHFGNNFLYIAASQQLQENGPIENYDTIITIPDGYYNEYSLINAINALLCPKDSCGNIMYEDSIFSYIMFSLDVAGPCGGTETKQVTVMPDMKSCMGCTIKNIELNFCRGIDGEIDDLKYNTKIGRVLGFTGKLYTGSVFYTGEIPMEVNTIKYVYLSVDDYQRNVNQLFLSGYPTSNFDENVLARISLGPLGAASGGKTLAENDFNLITEPRKYFGPVDIQKLRIQLFDDFGQLLNLNNSDFSFVLLFKMVYDL